MLLSNSRDLRYIAILGQAHQTFGLRVHEVPDLLKKTLEVFKVFSAKPCLLAHAGGLLRIVWRVYDDVVKLLWRNRFKEVRDQYGCFLVILNHVFARVGYSLGVDIGGRNYCPSPCTPNGNKAGTATQLQKRFPLQVCAAQCFEQKPGAKEEPRVKHPGAHHDPQTIIRMPPIFFQVPNEVWPISVMYEGFYKAHGSI